MFNGQLFRKTSIGREQAKQDEIRSVKLLRKYV